MVSPWSSVCLSICSPVFHTSVGLHFCFWMITWVIVSGFSPNLVCALILWRCCMGLLMGNFRQFFTELSASNASIFLFQVHNLSIHLKCSNRQALANSVGQDQMLQNAEVDQVNTICHSSGGWVVRRCRVSYVTGASNWYWLTVGQGLLSL